MTNLLLLINLGYSIPMGIVDKYTYGYIPIREIF